MMLLSGDAESMAVDERQIIEGGCVARQRVKIEPRLGWLRWKAVTRHADHVDRAAREKSMADVEPLGHAVKRKSYERSYGRSAHLRMSERLADQLIANAVALAIRRHKKLSQEPKFTANPAPPEAEDFSVLISHPQACGIIPKRKFLKTRRSRRSHLAEASPFGEFVDAANYDLVQLASSRPCEQVGIRQAFESSRLHVGPGEVRHILRSGHRRNTRAYPRRAIT